MAVKASDLKKLQDEPFDTERVKKAVADLGNARFPVWTPTLPVFSDEALLQPLRQVASEIATQATEAVRRLTEVVTAPVLRLYDDLFGPGTLDGDLYLARTKGDSAALERLARRLRWAPLDPRAKEAMKARAAEMGHEQAYLLAFKPALLLAVARMEEPQRMRFGRDFLVGDDGRPVMMAPMHLPMPWFWRWLRKETINVMEADLLHFSYPTDCDACGRLANDVDLGVLADIEPDPEEKLLLAEWAAERERMLVLLTERCTPAERRLLSALLDGAPSLVEAARTIGVSPSTARVQYSGILRKARALAA